MKTLKRILPALSLGVLASAMLAANDVHGADEGGGGVGGGLRDNFGDLIDLVFPAIDFTSFLPPRVGSSYIDPIFGSEIKRVSDARSTPDLAGGGVLPLVTHEYATMSPFNSDSSRLLLLHFSYFALYDGDGNYLRSLPFEINASSEPRWSRDDPDLFYYLNGNSLKSFNVRSNEMRVIHTFNEYDRISGLGESEISEDGRYRVLVGDSRHIFVYDMVARSKGAVLTQQTAGSVDHVHLTPDNNVLVGWYRSGTTRNSGLELYDRNFNFRRQVAPIVSHMDVGRDENGAEVVLLHNSPHPKPPATCQNAVVKVRLSDLRQTCMISFPWGVGVHISAHGDSDHFIVSTYSGAATSGSPQNLRFQDEILRISMDGRTLERLAHHWSRAYDNYSFQPKASLSRDGSKLVYASNYRQQEKAQVPATYTDVFLLCVEDCTLQPNPGSDRGWIYNQTYQIRTFRTQEDDSSVSSSGSWSSLFHTTMSGDEVLISGQPGDALEYRFQGSIVGWVGYRGPMGGKARVLVDGQERAIVDTWEAKHRSQAELFAASDLGEGEHVLRIEVLEQDNPAATGESWVWVDAFDTRPSAPPAEGI